MTVTELKTGQNYWHARAEVAEVERDKLFRQNAELAVALKDSQSIQHAEKEILIEEIEAHVKTRKERDELAVALRHHGHLQMCPRFTSGFSQNPCDCGVENAKAILAAHDAALVGPLINLLIRSKSMLTAFHRNLGGAGPAPCPLEEDIDVVLAPYRKAEEKGPGTTFVNCIYYVNPERQKEEKP